MGTLTLVNYCLVITYFPSLIALHHRWSQSRSSGQPADVCCSCRIQDSDSGRPAESKGGGGGGGGGAAGSSGAAGSGSSSRPPKYWTQRVEEWLSDVFVPSLVRARIPVLSCGAALLGSLLFSITRFTTTDKDFTYLTFPEGTNIMSYLSQVEFPPHSITFRRLP